ncbi:hypothetical protein JXVLWARM_CDS_0064 [Burkholderia phage Bm1]
MLQSRLLQAFNPYGIIRLWFRDDRGARSRNLP